MPEGTDKPLLLSVKGIARMLGVSSRTVRRWQEQGLLPEKSFECGGVTLWERARINGWVKSGGTPAKALPAAAQKRTQADKL